MARGGKREGSGRPKGAANAKTREIADRAASEGITPLEVMLWAMREAYDAKDAGTALDAASKAAPYMHPRLTAIQHGGDADNPLIHVIEERIIDPKA